MYDSILIPGLREKVVTAITSSMLKPEYKDLSPAFWQRVGEDLTDPRMYYIAGMGHIEPKLEELEKSIGECVAAERERLSLNQQEAADENICLPPLPDSKD